MARCSSVRSKLDKGKIGTAARFRHRGPEGPIRGYRRKIVSQEGWLSGRKQLSRFTRRRRAIVTVIAAVEVAIDQRRQARQNLRRIGVNVVVLVIGAIKPR